MKLFQSWLKKIKGYVDMWWYAPLLGFLAFIDLFIIIVPTDGLLVSSILITPRRWIYLSLATTFGTSLGALSLAAILEIHGLPFLQYIAPSLDQSSAWLWTQHLMDHWGGVSLFIVAISPFMQHPAIAIAALAKMPLYEIFAWVFAGRLLKYLFLGLLSRYAPEKLEKLWGIQDEIKEATK